MRDDFYSNPLPVEKAIGVLTYMTGGMVGFLWLILGAILRQRLKPFMMFHVYQSIFLSLLFAFIGYALEFVFFLISKIPYVGNMVAALGVLLTIPLLKFYIFNISILTLLMMTFIVYLSVGVVLGKLSYVPWVSGIIRQNIER